MLLTFLVGCLCLCANIGHCFNFINSNNFMFLSVPDLSSRANEPFPMLRDFPFW